MNIIRDVTCALDPPSSAPPKLPMEQRTSLEAAAGILVGLFLGLCLWGALVLLLLPLFD